KTSGSIGGRSAGVQSLFRTHPRSSFWGGSPFRGSTWINSPSSFPVPVTISFGDNMSFVAPPGVANRSVVLKIRNFISYLILIPGPAQRYDQVPGDVIAKTSRESKRQVSCDKRVSAHSRNLLPCLTECRCLGIEIQLPADRRQV